MPMQQKGGRRKSDEGSGDSKGNTAQGLEGGFGVTDGMDVDILTETAVDKSKRRRRLHVH